MADYSLLPIRLEPGLVSLESPYAAKGRFIVDPTSFTGNVRFYQGRPEKAGGFLPFSASLDSAARDSHAWAALDGTQYLAWGTANKLWLSTGGALYDITPAGMPPLGSSANQTGFGQLGFGQYWFGGSSASARIGVKSQMWTLGNWGEDLIACYWGGPLYRWVKANGTATAAITVTAAPAGMLTFFVSERDRHLVLLGASDPGKTIIADGGGPMTMAWSNTNDLATWIPSIGNNEAGNIRFEIGSTILATVGTQIGQLILTDGASYIARFAGLPYVFTTSKVSEGHDAPLGPRAIISKDGIGYWMGQDHVHAFDGMVRTLTCPVRDVVFKNIDGANAFRVCAGLNRKFGEVTFFYPDVRDGTGDNSRSVSNAADGWWLGNYGRTSWLDENVTTTLPIACGPDGKLYLHETGIDAAGVALPWSLETGAVEIGNGDQFMHVRKLLPDYQRIAGQHSVMIETYSYPMPAAGEFDIGTARTVTGSTYRISVRGRGRHMRLKWLGSSIGSDFRLGQWRAQATVHGSR